MKAKDLKTGQTVFFSVSEQYWNKPYVMKRHHVYLTKSMVIRGKVEDIKGQEFKVRLFGNNKFEKDGESFVFHEDKLLIDQNYTDLYRLGKWYGEDGELIN